MADDRFVTFDEALTTLGLTEERLMDLVASNEIRAFRISREMQFKEADVRDLAARLASGAEASAAPVEEDVVDLMDADEVVVDLVGDIEEFDGNLELEMEELPSEPSDRLAAEPELEALEEVEELAEIEELGELEDVSAELSGDEAPLSDLEPMAEFSLDEAETEPMSLETEEEPLVALEEESADEMVLEDVSELVADEPVAELSLDEAEAEPVSLEAEDEPLVALEEESADEIVLEEVPPLVVEAPTAEFSMEEAEPMMLEAEDESLLSVEDEAVADVALDAMTELGGDESMDEISLEEDAIVLSEDEEEIEISAEPADEVELFEETAETLVMGSDENEFDLGEEEEASTIVLDEAAEVGLGDEIDLDEDLGSATEILIDDEATSSTEPLLETPSGDGLGTEEIIFEDEELAMMGGDDDLVGTQEMTVQEDAVSEDFDMTVQEGVVGEALTLADDELELDEEGGAPARARRGRAGPSMRRRLPLETKPVSGNPIMAALLLLTFMLALYPLTMVFTYVTYGYSTMPMEITSGRVALDGTVPDMGTIIVPDHFKWFRENFEPENAWGSKPSIDADEDILPPLAEGLKKARQEEEGGDEEDEDIDNEEGGDDEGAEAEAGEGEGEGEGAAEGEGGEEEAAEEGEAAEGEGEEGEF